MWKALEILTDPLTGIHFDKAHYKTNFLPVPCPSNHLTEDDEERGRENGTLSFIMPSTFINHPSSALSLRCPRGMAESPRTFLCIFYCKTLRVSSSIGNILVSLFTPLVVCCFYLINLPSLFYWDICRLHNSQPPCLWRRWRYLCASVFMLMFANRQRRRGEKQSSPLSDSFHKVD